MLQYTAITSLEDIDLRVICLLRDGENKLKCFTVIGDMVDLS